MELVPVKRADALDPLRAGVVGVEGVEQDQHERLLLDDATVRAPELPVAREDGQAVGEPWRDLTVDEAAELGLGHHSVRLRGSEIELGACESLRAGPGPRRNRASNDRAGVGEDPRGLFLPGFGQAWRDRG